MSSNPATRLSRPLYGAALLALSALLFSLMGVAIREASISVNNESVVFFRNLVGVLFFLPLIAFKGFAPLQTQRLSAHLWRTGYGLAAMYCFFYAIAHLPLADAMLFTYSAPVFTPLSARRAVRKTAWPLAVHRPDQWRWLPALRQCQAPPWPASLAATRPGQ